MIYDPRWGDGQPPRRPSGSEQLGPMFFPTLGLGFLLGMAFGLWIFHGHLPTWGIG